MCFFFAKPIDVTKFDFNKINSNAIYSSEKIRKAQKKVREIMQKVKEESFIEEQEMKRKKEKERFNEKIRKEEYAVARCAECHRNGGDYYFSETLGLECSCWVCPYNT